VFAASDMLAVGALSAAREKGVRVPEDLSIAGFDDIDFAAYCNPPLTTVRVPAAQMGEMAVEMLLEMIEGDSMHVRQITLDTELVIRESCNAV
jgi:DNA-binding LacI/PurR family transcriptional regulator